MIEASIENRIIPRHPIAPPSGRTSKFPNLMEVVFPSRAGAKQNPRAGR